MLSILHNNKVENMRSGKSQVHEVGGQAAKDQTDKTKQVSDM